VRTRVPCVPFGRDPLKAVLLEQVDEDHGVDRITDAAGPVL